MIASSPRGAPCIREVDQRALRFKGSTLEQFTSSGFVLQV